MTSHDSDLAYQIGTYLASDEGSIWAAGMVLRQLVDHYVENPDFAHDPETLSPNDWAIIVSAFRVGIPGIGPGVDSDHPYADIEDYQGREMRTGIQGNARLAQALTSFIWQEF